MGRGRITPIGFVLLTIMVLGFAYGFLGHGEAAGFSLLIAAIILLLIAGASFTRGGRAARARTIEDIAKGIDERNERERLRDRSL